MYYEGQKVLLAALCLAWLKKTEHHTLKNETRAPKSCMGQIFLRAVLRFFYMARQKESQWTFPVDIFMGGAHPFAHFLPHISPAFKSAASQKGEWMTENHFQRCGAPFFSTWQGKKQLRGHFRPS